MKIDDFAECLTDGVAILEPTPTPRASAADRAREKAIELADEFCHPLDVIKPNKTSIRNAIKCCEQILKLRVVISVPASDVPYKYEAGFWRLVIKELEDMNQTDIK